ncbi:hypothetical protein BJ508DRAFT_341979 [Ascobolus immersus RN42]|uniref:Uncharacterized protein n=1 Tax=Ascobolus immersus RN42 TaxID=1160509 RepID=A0A3N4HTP9_ASCIM|nr:hypothetical protein BJ508DRAFT_341979 [Ascobolus immersus RN42]
MASGIRRSKTKSDRKSRAATASLLLAISSQWSHSVRRITSAVHDQSAESSHYSSPQLSKNRGSQSLNLEYSPLATSASVADEERATIPAAKCSTSTPVSLDDFNARVHMAVVNYCYEKYHDPIINRETPGRPKHHTYAQREQYVDYVLILTMVPRVYVSLSFLGYPRNYKLVEELRKREKSFEGNYTGEECLPGVEAHFERIVRFAREEIGEWENAEEGVRSVGLALRTLEGRDKVRLEDFDDRMVFWGAVDDFRVKDYGSAIRKLASTIV